MELGQGGGPSNGQGVDKARAAMAPDKFTAARNVQSATAAEQHEERFGAGGAGRGPRKIKDEDGDGVRVLRSVAGKCRRCRS